jgi:hypothetical protein
MTAASASRVAENASFPDAGVSADGGSVTGRVEGTVFAMTLDATAVRPTARAAAKVAKCGWGFA